MNAPPIVTLLTDFGIGSPYVGEMKGALLSVAPHATIVDLFHGVSPQNVQEGAIRLESCIAFPPGSIHIAVVDPGVGAGRSVLFARIDDRLFIAPDNGLLSWIASERDVQELRRIENRALFRSVVSRTFEGRDVMAPVAGALCRGASLAELGPEIESMRRLDFSPPRREGDAIKGRVLYVDSFGNVVTDIRRSDVPADRRIVEASVGETVCRTVVETYAQAAPGELVILYGSQDRLEFAVVNGSAATRISAESNATVTVRLGPDRSSDGSS